MSQSLMPSLYTKQLLIALLCIMGGCLANVMVLEKILTRAPQAQAIGKIITLGHFLFIALEGLQDAVAYHPKRGLTLRPRRIPLNRILCLVALFWGSNVTNNLAFAYNISIPLHTMFRSLSLASSMLLGVVLVGKRYNVLQVLSVVLITLGVFLATYAASSADTHKAQDGAAEENFDRWLTGIGLLVATVLLSSLNGIVQDLLVKPSSAESDPGSEPVPRWEEPLPQWKEVMLYTHLFGIPVFGVFAGDICRNVHVFLEDGTLLGLLALNAFTQWLCIRGVLQLTQLTDALTLTMVITLRKMISLLFSVYFFGNAFTGLHWGAAFLTFGGSVLYAVVAKRPKAKLKAQ
uniref:Sugar phosphate transporter domain-containing protein n=1 Tax=Eutreptiella gymnastica TaxID=73025 RepID=A0A7S4GH81_9EUGL